MLRKIYSISITLNVCKPGESCTKRCMDFLKKNLSALKLITKTLYLIFYCMVVTANHIIHSTTNIVLDKHSHLKNKPIWLILESTYLKSMIYITNLHTLAKFIHIFKYMNNY